MFPADAYPVIAVRDRIAIDYTLGSNRSPEGIEKCLGRDLLGLNPRSVCALLVCLPLLSVVLRVIAGPACC